MAITLTKHGSNILEIDNTTKTESEFYNINDIILVPKDNFIKLIRTNGFVDGSDSARFEYTEVTNISSSSSEELIEIISGLFNAGTFDGKETSTISDYYLQHAIQVAEQKYSVKLNAFTKNKDLLKFGRNANIQTTKTTLMTLQDGVFNESYISTNLIDTVSSSNASDTEVIVVEGHTIDGSGDFTFVSQSVTLNGRNKVVLSTPLARANRMVNDGSNNLLGSVYCYEDVSISNGVPSDGTKTHCIIDIGFNNSEKAATTISKDDFFIVTEFYGHSLELITALGNTAFGNIQFELREKGKTFISIIDKGVHSTGGNADYQFKPYLIIPANSDIRLRGTANDNGKDFSGGIQGVLCSVIS
tara:strand:- start:770 stop:1846 length:1077 start_codon:yes stop_codon:yes gene_type:complete